MANERSRGREQLASVENKWTNATSVSLYAYGNDDLGRRDDLSFSSDLTELPDYAVDWGYNTRNELTSGTRTGGGAGSCHR